MEGEVRLLGGGGGEWEEMPGRGKWMYTSNVMWNSVMAVKGVSLEGRGLHLEGKGVNAKQTLR